MKFHKPLSQTIVSMGYPATGHVTINISPATIAFFSMGRINGRPYTFSLAECSAEPTLDDAIHLYKPPSLVWIDEMLRCETTSPFTVTY
jgi:hypothetical protein